MIINRPKPSAEVRALFALVLNATRNDPNARPGPGVIAWQRDFASSIGVEETHPRTNLELLGNVLAMRRTVDERGLSSTVAAAA